MDIEIKDTRDKSNMSSPNFSRKPSILFGVLFMNYVKRVQALANNPI